MKRLLVAAVLVVLCGVVLLLWRGRPVITRLLRERIAKELSTLTSRPVYLDQLTVSAFPPRLYATGITIGDPPALAKVTAIDVSMSPLDSARERRLALTVRVESPVVDFAQLAGPSHPTAKTDSPFALPPLYLQRIEVTQAELRFPLGKAPATVAVANLAGDLKTGLLGRDLVAKVDVRGVEMKHKTYSAIVAEIHADGGADAEGLYVNRASAHGEQLDLEVNATAIAHRHTASANFDPRVLGVFVDKLDLLSGRVHVEGTLSGSLADPHVDGELTLPRAVLAGRTLGDLTTHIVREGATFQFDDLRLTGDAGQGTGSVTLKVVDEVPIQAALAWEHIDLEALLALIGTPIPFRNLLTATTVMQGQFDPLDLHVTGSGTAQSRNPGAAAAVANWEAKATVRPAALEGGVELTQGDLVAGGNRASAVISIEHSNFGGSLTVKSADVQALSALLPEPIPQLALQGKGEGNAFFSGTLDAPVISGTVAFQDATIAWTPVPYVGGDFSIAAGALTTSALRMNGAPGEATLSGTLSLGAAENRWQLSLKDLDTDLAVSLARGITNYDIPLSSGALSGTIRCSGSWAQPDLQMTLSQTSPRLLGEPLERIDVDATMASSAWKVRAQATHVAGETFSIDAAGTGIARIEATFDGGPFSLTNFRDGGDRRLDGTVAIHGRLSGAALQPNGSIDVTVSHLAVRNRLLGDGAIHAEGKNGNWRIQSKGTDETWVADGTIDTKAPFPYRLTAQWRALPLARLVSADEALQVAATGSLETSGSLSQLAASRGSLELSDFHLTHDTYEVHSAEPIRLVLANSRLHVASFVLAGEGSRLAVTGDVATDGLVDIEARGEGGLVLLELLGPPVTAARGQVALTVQVRHRTASAWELKGEASLHDAVLDLGLPIAFTKTNGSFRLQGSTIQVESLSGKAGGGSFDIGGVVDLGSGPHLSWKFADVGLSPGEGMEARIKGNGHATGNWKEITVDGSIEVLHALYDKDFGWSEIVPLLMAQISPPPARPRDPNSLRVPLNLLVYSRGGVFVDNNLAQVQMWLNLAVGGMAESPIVSGTVGFLDGEFTFRGRKFTIDGGTVDFRDRWRNNPVLNISAESLISNLEGDYTVTVLVTGTANDPRVQFSASDPTLSQTDVLSLTTFGKTTAQLQRENRGVSAVDALALLPTGAMERQFGKLVGIDRFEIQTTQSRNTGTVEPRVTIGKDLTDKLRAAVWTSFGTEQRHSVQLEYRLSRRMSLLGSWESQTTSETGAFGGDLTFRYEFRKLPYSLLGFGE